MKLTGSLTEETLREALKTGNIALADSSKEKTIISFLTRQYSTISSVYALDWVFEPDMETFVFLMNGEFVISFEYDRLDYSCKVIEEISISKYKKGLKKKDQLRLLVALDLIKNG